MKFKDSEGKFRESLAEDIQGMLSLYEASHLRGHGEEILDEAFIFTTTHLKSLPSSLSPPDLLEQVNHSLKHPIRKSIQRREARRYLSVYEQDDSHDEALLSLAKLDFNQLQQLYKKELCELTRFGISQVILAFLQVQHLVYFEMSEFFKVFIFHFIITTIFLREELD